ncbi:hypothetical protein ACHBTE_34375 [Streptomyces sp. M41]|uniref:hypothetical protein n=1 Tax=Streptomyces sp. M41 TaxID=3059412 RepID=UPI00374D2392
MTYPVDPALLSAHTEAAARRAPARPHGLTCASRRSAPQAVDGSRPTDPGSTPRIADAVRPADLDTAVGAGQGGWTA